MTTLTTLLRKYPLPKGWSRPELFEDRLELNGITLELRGLHSQNESGQIVTGSAVERDLVPLNRAFFELVERVSIVEAEASVKQKYPALDITESPLGVRSHTHVFPENPEPELWRLSRSNGVAIHTDWKRACEAASFELIERDRLLRSWFGEFSPKPWSGSTMPRALEKYYDFEYYLFHSPAGERDVVAAGVFGFPKEAGLGRVYGSAARATAPEAFEAASRECLQGLGFMWKEALPKTAPAFSPTSDFHQESFLLESGLVRIRHWLQGGHTLLRGIPAKNQFEFFDLTPPTLRGKLCVVKAVDSTIIPLIFGKAPGRELDNRWLHPFA